VDDGNHSGLSVTDVNIRNPLWSTISEIVRDTPWQASKIWEWPWVWEQKSENHIYTPIQQMSNTHSCWTYAQTCPHSLLSTSYALSSWKHVWTTYIPPSISSYIIPFHPLLPSGPDLMALNISKVHLPFVLFKIGKGTLHLSPWISSWRGHQNWQAYGRSRSRPGPNCFSDPSPWKKLFLIFDAHPLCNGWIWRIRWKFDRWNRAMAMVVLEQHQNRQAQWHTQQWPEH